MVVDGHPVIRPTGPLTEDGQDSGSAGGLTLEQSGEDEGDELPEARVLAGKLDLNHAPKPGGLKEIGTCRRCGLIIAKDKQGVWSHQPSAGEFDAGEAWIDRNPSNGVGRSEPSGNGAERADSSTRSQPEGEVMNIGIIGAISGLMTTGTDPICWR